MGASREFALCGLGNALVDITLDVTREELQEMQYPGGTMHLVSSAEQRALLTKFASRSQVLCPGGSVANSVVAFAELGGRCSFLGALGKDRYGDFFLAEFHRLGIAMHNPLAKNAQTGTCVALVTPDAERTMRTCLGVSADLGEEHIDATLIERSEWLLIEGYLFSNPRGPRAIRKAIDIALAVGTRVALTLSAEFIVKTYAAELAAALKGTDLLFANEKEAAALLPGSERKSLVQELSRRIPLVAVTLGEQGALVGEAGTVFESEAFRVRPVDATGAGDMFAGAFLLCFLQGQPLSQAARCACFMASRVVAQYGARLKGGAMNAYRAFHETEQSERPAQGNMH